MSTAYTVDTDMATFKAAVREGTYRPKLPRTLPLWIVGNELIVARVHVDPLYIRVRRDAGAMDERAQYRAELRIYPKPESGYVSG